MSSSEGFAGSGSTDLEATFDINDSDLAARVEGLSVSQINQLPFGAIRLDAEGRVSFLSQTEAQQSGLRSKNTIGLRFFTELAPCMANPDFVNRMDQARRAGKLDISFRQIGDFADAQRELYVRVLSAADRGLWVFIQRVN